MTPDEEIIAAAREGFLAEADDMLRQFEDALLVMETDPANAENLNAAFRAAHTIKGTAGLFGCDAVVSFTHHAETLMEALRAGERLVDDEVIAALLQSRDQIEALLDEVRTGQSSPSTAQRSTELGAVLHALISEAKTGDTAASTGTATAGSSVPKASHAGPQTGVNTRWLLSLRFGPDTLRHGLDPLAFIRYLDKVGKVAHIHLMSPQIPALDHLDPESCYLGFEIALDSTHSASDILSVFDFVMDDCDLQLLPPTASAEDFTSLLERRAGDDVTAKNALIQIWRTQGLVIDRTGPQTAPEPTPSLKGIETEASATGPTPTQAQRQPSTTAPAKDPERRVATKDRRGDEARYIRVRADKLDTLIDLIGELVIASSGAQIIAQRESSSAFMEAAQRIRDLVESARDGTLALRMVPIGETFARFQRVVRDVSKQLGKTVELEITGGDTELDKSMVEAIADPLMHLVRNSLDHGIETSVQRQENGKSSSGRLALNAYQETGQIVIEVSDDGRGLHRDRIFKKAVEKGLIHSDAQLSDNEVHQLICLPGFSTAEQVTDISGRGVGMDVVKRNIDALRGQMHIASIQGQGTTTQIRLPLTLAIIDGFLCTVDTVHYVVPLEMVSECIETPKSCYQGEGIAGYFDLRGEVLPYLNLRRYLGHPEPRAGRQSMIVVRLPNQRVGLLVDRLLGEYQTVIKPLGRLLRNMRVIAGSTILGTGEVALVLDVSSLIDSATTLLTQVHALLNTRHTTPTSSTSTDVHASTTA